MEEIEVGEYVRTKEGLIEKIKKINPHYTKGKREGQEVEENYLLMGQEQCKFIESIDYRIPPCYPSDEEIEKIAQKVLELQKVDGVKTTQSLLTFQEVQQRYHKEIYQKFGTTGGGIILINF